VKITKERLKKIIKEELDEEVVVVAGHERLKSKVLKDLVDNLRFLGQQSEQIEAGEYDFDTILTILRNSHAAIKGLKGKK
tara:strand:+ start:240 stop:479 length:240 start_codon:yes stop_codon:yes gene_type:complete